MKFSLLAFTFVLVAVPTFARRQSIQSQSATDICEPNHNWEDGCEVDAPICQITCDKADACCTNPCETESGLESETIDSYAAMTATKCSELCETSKASATDEGHRCRFWRYVSLKFKV